MIGNSITQLKLEPLASSDRFINLVKIKSSTHSRGPADLVFATATLFKMVRHLYKLEQLV